MTSRQTISHEAADRAGMTLRELAAFVQDAMRRDVNQNTRVTVRATIRGGIKSVAVTGEAGTDADQ